MFCMIEFEVSSVVLESNLYHSTLKAQRSNT